MAVYYQLPGIGLSAFDDGTTPEQAFKIAGVELPKAEPEAKLIPSLKRGTGQLAAGIGSAIKDVYPETGEAVENWGTDVQAANPPAYPSLSSIHGVGSALGYAGERLAEGAPLLAGGAALSAIPVVGEAAATGLMGGAMGAQTYGDVRAVQRDTGNEDIPSAVGAGVIGGVLGVAGGAGSAAKNLLARGAEEGVKGIRRSAVEGALEQAAISPVVGSTERAAEGKPISDSDAWSDYLEQAASGAVVGGAFGAASGVAGKFKKAPVDDTKPTDILKPTDIFKPTADTGVNRDLNKDLFGHPPTPQDTTVPTVTPADLASLQAERRRLSRAMADAADSSEYYKYQDALGKVDAAIAHPAMQFLERQQQSSAAFDADQQLDMMLTPQQKPRPAPAPVLGLPSPDKFNPPMYVDSQGNVGREPNAQGNLFAPDAGAGVKSAAPFSVGDTVSIKDKDGVILAPPSKLTDVQRHPSGVLYGQIEGGKGYYPLTHSEKIASASEAPPQVPSRYTPSPTEPAPRGGQPPMPLTGAGQPSLFGVTPTASVKSDFGPREILQRLRAADNYRGTKGRGLDGTARGFANKTDSFTLKVANGLARALDANDSFAANRWMDEVHEALQGSPLSAKTVDNRMKVVNAGRDLVDDYNARMVDAYAQEAKQRAPQPGAQVTNDTAGQQANARVAEANRLAEQQQQADAAAQQQQQQAQAAIQQRAAAEAQMAQANQTIVDSHRNAIVQKVLNNPAETNHAARISETLKRNGLDPELRPHEQEAADRMAELQRQRADATEAFSRPDMVEDTNPNQPIFEQREQAPERELAPKESNTTRGRYAPENFRLENQTEEGLQRQAAARDRRESRVAAAEPTPPRDTRQREMFTKTGRVKKEVDNTVNRDPNAPENFKLQRPRPGDIREPAAEAVPEDALAFSPSPKQGEMFTPTGKVRKAVDQSPPKVEQPKPETRGEQIKQAVAEKNAPTRERIKGTLKLKPKEEPNAEVRQEPEGNRAEHSDGGERGTPAEASGGDRAEEGREVQAPTEADQLAESRDEQNVTYDSVLREAESHASSDLLKPYELQKIKQLAQGKAVTPEQLKESLDAAVQRNAERAMGDRAKAATDAAKRPEYTDENVKAAFSDLRDRLDQLGLHDIGLSIYKNLIAMPSGPAHGAYSPSLKLIRAAMDGARNMGNTLNHEVVHALVDLAVITPGEYDVVQRAAKRIPELSKWVDDHYPNLDAVAKGEELVAEAYSRWAAGDLSFQPQGILGKIKRFFEAIRNAFTGRGFRTAEDVMNAIESGEMGSRPREPDVASEPGVDKARAAAIDALPDKLKPVAHGILDSLSDLKDRAIAYAVFTEDLARRVKEVMPSGLKYVKDMTAKAQEFRGHEADYQKALDNFQALKPELQKVGDGTVNGVIQAMNNEKKWGFEPEFLTKRTTNPLSITVDPAMAAKFNALPKEAQDVVKGVFQKNHEMLQLQKEAASGGSTGIYDAAIKRATADGKPKTVIDALKAERNMVAGEFQKLLDIQEAEPYNPQRRYGDYVAFAKSKELKDAEAAGDNAKVQALKAQEDHYFMRQYDTFAQAQAAVRDLRKLPQYDNVLDARQTDKSTDALVGARGMMLAFQQLRNFIRDQVSEGDVSPAVLNGINKLAADLYIRSLRQSSSRKSELRRIGVGGGDMDQMRNFITQGRATAHFIAAMKHNDTILDTIGKMRDEAKGSPDSNAMTAFNEIIKRHADGMTFNPAPFANRVKQFTGAYMIISSPAFYLEQIMQPALLSTPFMGGRHGYTTAVRQMTKAYGDVTKLWSGAGHGQLDVSKITDANVRNAINELSDRGIINVGQHMELGSASELRDRGIVGNGAQKVYKFFSDLTSKLEAVNRVSTGIAAYKLERTKQLAEGKSSTEAHDAATDYAYRVIYDTHGSYDGFNAPRFMRGGLLGVVTQFRKFSIMQASLLAKLASGAIQEADPIQRAAMRKALAFTVAHAAILGGAMALPGAATAKWAINKLLTTDTEPGDIEERMRSWLGDEALSNILLKGVPTLGTHGIDISDRVGLGTATSVFPFLKDDPGTTYVDTTKSALLSLLGPTLGSIAPQWADGFDLMHQWQYWKGLEKFLPKGFANASKAMRESQQGVTNRRDDQLMKPEDISFGHSFATAIGLPTAVEAERLRGSSVETTKEQFYKDRTKRITLEFTEARRAGDSAGMQDARDRFRELQDAKFKEGLPRSPMSTLFNAAVQQRLRERATVEGVQYKPRSPGLRHARELEREEAND